MKRFSFRQILLLCLPLCFIAIALVVSLQSRRQLRAYFSQPFTPRLEIVRGQTPRVAGPSLFQIDAKCLAIGGTGQSSWLVRAQLFELDGKKPREIWNSQKMLVPGHVGFIMAYWNGVGPVHRKVSDRFASQSGMAWRFEHYEGGPDHFKIIVEAVAIPFPPDQQGELGTQTFNVTEATPAQIDSARQQPGARYFRESLVFEATKKDNAKFLDS